MKPRTAQLPLLGLVVALVPGCGLPTVGAMARYGSFDVDGDLSISASGASADNDVNAMGLEKDDEVLGLDAYFKWGSPHLSLSFQDTDHSGSGALEAAISDSDGNNIPAGTPVSSDLELGLYTGALTFDLLPGEFWELGLGFGVSYVDFDTEIRDPGTGTSIDADESVPIPLLAARGGLDLGRFQVTALLSGVGAKIDGDSISYIDLDLKGKLRLFGTVGAEGFLVLGYRVLDFDLDYKDGNDDVDAELTFDGIYIGFEVSW